MKIVLSILFAVLSATTAMGVSARSPEVLATYSAAPAFRNSVLKLEPRLRSACLALLDLQIRLQAQTDSWKLYSLYEMLASQNLMTGALVRVPTVTLLSESLPKYTSYRLIQGPLTSAKQLPNGSILIADVGRTCGPDPLSVTKGAYFLKCGDDLIGSGLISVFKLKMKECANVRVLAPTL